MKKKLSLLAISIALFSVLPLTHIQAAAELPAINIKATEKLWYAVCHGDLATAQQALAEGANINTGEAGDRKKEPITTPLHAAILSKNFSMIPFLLAQGAIPDMVSSCANNAPLGFICLNEELSTDSTIAIATELLTYKANINTQNHKNKNTPLHNAISKAKNNVVIKLLIFAGADITIKNVEGKTPFDMIETVAMQQTCQEACIINDKAFKQLRKVELALYLEIITHPNVPVEELALAFNDSIPHYTDQGESQRAYDLLNMRIAEQWAYIKKKLEITRLLNQQNCLPIQSVAAIAADYLFSKQQ